MRGGGGVMQFKRAADNATIGGEGADDSGKQ